MLTTRPSESSLRHSVKEHLNPTGSARRSVNTSRTNNVYSRSIINGPVKSADPAGPCTDIIVWLRPLRILLPLATRALGPAWWSLDVSAPVHPTIITRVRRNGFFIAVYCVNSWLWGNRAFGLPVARLGVAIPSGMLWWLPLLDGGIVLVHNILCPAPDRLSPWSACRRRSSPSTPRGSGCSFIQRRSP